MAAFDIVINNTDRKGGHCLRATDDGSIFGIDHGVSFHAQWKVRTVIWDFAGEPIPPDVCADLHRLADELRGDLGERLAPLLDRFELDAVQARLGHLLATGEYPRRRPRLPLLPLADDLDPLRGGRASTPPVGGSTLPCAGLRCVWLRP